ncbi:MAG: xanthine dehydrogenase family protein molybdopterin-binding subunit [Cyanobacteria bacterium P01_H01_bin.58]
MGGFRIEGRQKVSGSPLYVDDLRHAETALQPLFAVAVTSRVATGKIAAIETDAALETEGVEAIATHLNAPRLKTVTSPSLSEPGSRVPLQSPQIDYAGQAVALVIAKTLAAAKDGAAAVNVQIEVGSSPAVTLADSGERLAEVNRAGIAPGKLKKGEADSVLAHSAFQIDETFHSAPHHQNGIEPCAVIANWDDDGGVTIHAAVQWHHIDSMMVGQAFGLGFGSGLIDMLGRVILKRRHQNKVRLINHFSGGAFGRNISIQALLLAPIAAKVAGRPVKFVHTRRDTFTLMSHRGEVRQQVWLGADAEGHLKSIIIEPDIAHGHAAFVEPVGEMPMQVYSHEAHRLTTRAARLDLPGAGWMRGPGVSSAIFALEQSMDILAEKLGIDPLDLRLSNYAADNNPMDGKPWESKALRGCYEKGAAEIGWRNRVPGGTLRPDGRLTGFGMATAIDQGRQFPATAHITLTKAGEVIVSIAIAEIGQGLLTGLTGLISEMTGLPMDKVTFKREKTSEGYAAGSIGSTGTYSNAAAVLDALKNIRRRMVKEASRMTDSGFQAGDWKRAQLKEGHLVADNGASVSILDILSRTGDLSASGRAGLTFGASKEAKASFGAVFCEVAVDQLTLEMTVVRLIGAYDCGRVLQPKIARAQLIGAMTMGMGQALMEETRLDRRTGAWTNPELGEALVPTQADVPYIEAHFVGEDEAGEGFLNFKGIAETGIVGVAPAIVSAFADATGGRCTAIPMTYAERFRATAGMLTHKQKRS